jgi:hypothetical protein
MAEEKEEEEEEEEGEVEELEGGRGSKGGFPLHHRGWPRPCPQRLKPGVWSHGIFGFLPPMVW